MTIGIMDCMSLLEAKPIPKRISNESILVILCGMVSVQAFPNLTLHVVNTGTNGLYPHEKYINGLYPQEKYIKGVR